MSTTRDGFEAGVDAVIADNTLNRQGFVDAVQTVITSGLSNVEGNAWVDAMAIEYNRLDQINNPTYSNLRGDIISRGKATSMDLFDAFSNNITGLPESVPVIQAAQLTFLRDERDNIDSAIARFDVLIAAEGGGTVGRLVKDEMREAKQRLRVRKDAIRQAIGNITGDPDS
tara:strand:+ start:11899 stop:12411 length:513 start_codon:yes stop_codon:yes gene_type:complete